MAESSAESNSNPEASFESIAESKIRALGLTEAMILYYKCQGTKYRRQRQLLKNISQHDFEAATARLYVNLGVDLALLPKERIRKLREKFCPIFERLLLTLPGKDEAKFEHWPPAPIVPQLVVEPTPMAEPAPDPEPTPPPLDYNYALLVVQREIQAAENDMDDEDDEEGEEDKEKRVGALLGGSNVIIENGRKRRPGWLIAVLWLLSLCLMAGCAGAAVYLWLPRSSPAAATTPTSVVTAVPASASPAPSPTVVVVATNVPQPTGVPPTQTPFILVVTATSLPPAASAPPAATATPAFQLPFVETFDQSLRPEWSRRGNFLIIQGWLGAASSDAVYLTVGDTSLDNYQVALDFRPSRPTDYFEFFLQFGANLRLKVTYSELQWFLSQDGTSFNQTGDAFFKPGAGGTLAVQVHGSAANVILNGHQSQPSTYSNSMAGPITLILTSPSTRIDNFKIDALP